MSADEPEPTPKEGVELAQRPEPDEEAESVQEAVELGEDSPGGDAEASSRSNIVTRLRAFPRRARDSIKSVGEKARRDPKINIAIVALAIAIPGSCWATLQFLMNTTGTSNIWELTGRATDTPTATSAPALTAKATVQPTTTNTLTNTPTATATSTPSATPTVLPSPILTPVLGSDPCKPSLSDPGFPKVSISEVMLVPQAPGGNANIETWNEYVELFNYGDEPIDVSGWWISDSGVDGKPDMLVAWDERLTGIPVGGAITDSTVIPPGGYALILSILYADGDKPYSEEVEEKTIVLTLADHPDTPNEVIGKDGLKGTGENLDVLVLYVGTEGKVELPVSTYGTPTCSDDRDPRTIRDNGDNIPQAISLGWGGFRRVHIDGVDTRSNWARFTWEERSPGY